MPRPLLDAPTAELAGWMAERGHPAYRARQVVRWVFDRRAESFDGMSDLPEGLGPSWTPVAGLRHARWPTTTSPPTAPTSCCCPASDGRTVECVLMAEDDRRTVCISTQVGCGMGCVFCASGLKGVERNLTAAEILEQVLRLRNLLPQDERLTNLVVMGMGESLANLDNLIPALDRLCSPEGLDFGQRRVTISTVGLPEKMRKLAELDRQYHLAVSLHAPTPELRDELVPINAKVGSTPVMEAADAYFRTDRPAGDLRVRAAGRPERPTRGRRGPRPAAGGPEGPRQPDPVQPGRGPAVPPAVGGGGPAVRADRPGRGVSVSVRKTKGREIDAACGQLRRRFAARGRGGRRRLPRRVGLNRGPGRRLDPPENPRATRGIDRWRPDETLEQQLAARDPDVRLMLQVRDDVQGAFEVLVERYQDRLVGVLTHLVGDPTRPRTSPRRSSCASTGPARGIGRRRSSRPGCSRSPTTWR